MCIRVFVGQCETKTRHSNRLHAVLQNLHHLANVHREVAVTHHHRLLIHRQVLLERRAREHRAIRQKLDHHRSLRRKHHVRERAAVRADHHHRLRPQL